MMQKHFDFSLLRRHHVADQCVCCGSRALKSTQAILMPFVAHRTFGWAPALIDESWGLNTVKNGMAYTVCRSLLCVDCGLLFSDIRFSDDELERLYRDYRGVEYTALRETYEPGYTLRNDALGQQLDYGDTRDFLEPLLPQGLLSILDWGGDSGKNTPLRQRAKNHDVYDISNCPVIDGARAVNREQVIRGGGYDLIVCSNVLEHVPYPSDLLLDICKVMRPESVLYVEVPFEEVIRQHGRDALTHKKHWHEHVNFFSPESIHALLANAGLKTVTLKVDASITAGLKSGYIMQAACRLA